MSTMQQAWFKSNAERAVEEELRLLALSSAADPAKIGKETTNLQSLTTKVAHICAHSGKAVNCFSSVSEMFFYQLK
jgi:hypothetical protein